MNRHTKVIQDERSGDLVYNKTKALASGFPGVKSKSAITIGAVALNLILSVMTLRSLFAQGPMTWETGHEIWKQGSHSMQHHNFRESVVLRDVFVPRTAYGHLYQSRWIAVGDSGMIVSGSAEWNGNSTTIRSNRTRSPTTADLHAVCSYKTEWIAVGKGGSILHGPSFNLGAWNLTTVGDSVQLIDVEGDVTNWVSVG